MFIQTRIQLKLQEIPESSSIVLGMEEHQNYNLTGSRQQFGKKTKQLHKKKLKIRVIAIKLIVQQKM